MSSLTFAPALREERVRFVVVTKCREVIEDDVAVDVVGADFLGIGAGSGVVTNASGSSDAKEEGTLRVKAVDRSRILASIRDATITCKTRREWIFEGYT